MGTLVGDGVGSLLVVGTLVVVVGPLDVVGLSEGSGVQSGLQVNRHTSDATVPIESTQEQRLTGSTAMTSH